MSYSRNYGKVFEHVQPIVPQFNHTVLYDLQTMTPNQPPIPYDKWSNNNQLIMVNLPHLKSNQIRTKQHGGGYLSKTLWQVIGESFSKEIKSCYELEKAILKYRELGGEFRALHSYCEQMENNLFFQETLPAIINLAYKLPSLIKTGIPLLKHGLNHSISLSQEQIACLLANAFLCTFPDQNSGQSFPDINFNRLFQSERSHVVEKIKCIVNYFDRVTKNMPTGVVTFIRRSVRSDHLPDWSKTSFPISKTTLNIMNNGTIEDQRELLQVDFANKYIGGGVIGGGCVQEEIRFMICPELIISRLFTEFLKDNEALIIAGAEQFSNYTGYADTFKFAGDHRDGTAIDHDSKRRRCYIVAIDALNFSNPYIQYEKKFIKRELNKAYVGFYHPLKDSTPPGVATGNWGCGAFKGDPQLKSLIQLMACAITKRPLYYFTFGNTTLSESLNDIYNYLKDNNINTLQLWEYMNEFKSKSKYDEDLFNFIKRRHRRGQESFYKEQDDHEKNSKNFKFEEIPTKTKPFKTTPYSHSQKSHTYAEVTKQDYSFLTNDISKNSHNTGAPMEQSHRTPTSQHERDNKTQFQPKITSFMHPQKSSQTYEYSAGAPMEQSHRIPTSPYERDNKTNVPNQINSFQNNLQDEDVSMKECQNNEIDNNQKVIDSYNKQSNSYISSDYSESGKKVNDIMKLYELATNNKAKLTSSSPGFSLGNLENDYSTTYSNDYRNKPISTNQTKYAQQNYLTTEESASGSSAYFDKNQGNNNLNLEFNNKSNFNKIEVDIRTERAEQVTENGMEWIVVPNNR